MFYAVTKVYWLRSESCGKSPWLASVVHPLEGCRRLYLSLTNINYDTTLLSVCTPIGIKVHLKELRTPNYRKTINRKYGKIKMQCPLNVYFYQMVSADPKGNIQTDMLSSKLVLQTPSTRRELKEHMTFTKRQQLNLLLIKCRK